MNRLPAEYISIATMGAHHGSVVCLVAPLESATRCSASRYTILQYFGMLFASTPEALENLKVPHGVVQRLGWASWRYQC